MEKFQEVYDKWADINRDLYKISKEYLTETLKKLPNQSIDISDELPEIPSVVYYGNHPEYDANPFSQVYGAYLKGEDIYISCEETNEFSADNISAWEMYAVADAVEQTIKLGLDMED